MDILGFEDMVIKGGQDHLPHVSIDCVIFGLHEDQLKVLILKLNKKDLWILPGGYVKLVESINDAALRVLQQRTGLSNIFLSQFKTFGSATRQFPDDVKTILESLGLTWSPESWVNQRFLSIGYYALVDYEKLNTTGGDFNQEFKWEDVSSLPVMLMDHKKIIEGAHESLKKDLNNSPIGYNLLPEKFTMPELQKMYEAILGVELERSHFQKKMLRLNIYERLNEKKQGVAHKRPFLYQFKKESYMEALKKGLKFDI